MGCGTLKELINHIHIVTHQKVINDPPLPQRILCLKDLPILKKNHCDSSEHQPELGGGWNECICLQGQMWRHLHASWSLHLAHVTVSDFSPFLFP